MQRFGIGGVAAAWMFRTLCAALLLASVCLPGPAMAGEWFPLATTGKPGETVVVPIMFRADGHTVASQAQLYTLDVYPLQFPAAGSIDSEGRGTCVMGADRRLRMFLDDALRASGTDIHVCSVPVLVREYPRMRVVLQTSQALCVGEQGQPLPCSSGGDVFLVDGIARAHERSVVIVPREVPRGPSQDVLLAFDYGDPTQRTPLASLESPRPVTMQRIFAPAWSAKTSWPGNPNGPARALLRSVRATYATDTQMFAALDALRADPQVEAVIPAPGLFPFVIYPAQPRAGEPFALWFAVNACTIYIEQNVDDRIVRVTAGVVHVLVPQLETLCGIPPGGEYHHVFNMPGMREGTYQLHVNGYSGVPPEAPDDSSPQTLVIGPAPGAVITPPRVVPGPNAWMLLLLAGSVLLLGWRRR